MAMHYHAHSSSAKCPRCEGSCEHAHAPCRILTGPRPCRLHCLPHSSRATPYAPCPMHHARRLCCLRRQTRCSRHKLLCSCVLMYPHVPLCMPSTLVHCLPHTLVLLHSHVSPCAPVYSQHSYALFSTPISTHPALCPHPHLRGPLVKD